MQQTHALDLGRLTHLKRIRDASMGASRLNQEKIVDAHGQLQSVRDQIRRLRDGDELNRNYNRSSPPVSTKIEALSYREIELSNEMEHLKIDQELLSEKSMAAGQLYAACLKFVGVDYAR